MDRQELITSLRARHMVIRPISREVQFRSNYVPFRRYQLRSRWEPPKITPYSSEKIYRLNGYAYK